MKISCSIFCESMNNSAGHYSCHQTTGSIGLGQIALESNYSKGHYSCNKTTGHKICHPHWFGINCSQYCKQSDSGIQNMSSTLVRGKENRDSFGHYSCDEKSGLKIC